MAPNSQNIGVYILTALAFAVGFMVGFSWCASEQAAEWSASPVADAAYTNDRPALGLLSNKSGSRPPSQVLGVGLNNTAPLGAHNTVHVLCNADERFMNQLRVVVFSIVAHTTRPVCMHILLDGDPAPAEAALTELRALLALEHPEKLVWKVYSQEVKAMLDKVPNDRKHMLGHVSRVTWARLYAPFIVEKHVVSVVYVDLDVLILGDVGQLLDSVDSERMPCGILGRASKPKHALWGRDNFPPAVRGNFKGSWNAGVMVMDLDYLRNPANGYTQQVIDTYLMQYHVNDQNALNMYCPSTRMHPPIPPIWNVYMYQDTDLKNWTNVRLLHWAGPNKPWNGNSKLSTLCRGRRLGPSHYRSRLRNECSFPRRTGSSAAKFWKDALCAYSVAMEETWPC